MNFEIKHFNDLTTKQLYEILKLRSEVFIVEQDCVYQDVDYKDDKSYHLFLMDNDECVATLRIIPRGISYDEVSIGRVVIKKSHRGRDLGTSMVDFAIKFVHDTMNENSIRISAQAHLLGFYSELGFKKVSDIYLEDDIEHLEMLYNN